MCHSCSRPLIRTKSSWTCLTHHLRWWAICASHVQTGIYRLEPSLHSLRQWALPVSSRGCHSHIRCRWLLQPGDGVAETRAAFDQVHQLLGETCCWCAIDEVMIEAERHTEILVALHFPIDERWPLGNAADHQAQRMQIGINRCPSPPGCQTCQSTLSLPCPGIV